MKCTIGTTNVKDFGRAIHALAKVGEELYIEPNQSGVSFRTISSSRSAFFSYNFGNSFFTFYDSGLGGQTPTSGEDAFRCKVAMKAVLNIFKGIHNLERTVQRCKLTLKWEDAKLVIQLTCHYGIVKTHNLSFIECDALQAVYDKESCPNHMVSDSRVLLGALSSFHQQTLEEISFCFTPRNLILKSHVEEPDPSKVVHTVVTLTRGEFEDYNIMSNCELTVCLKEIRALLAFTGSTGISTKAYFSGPGSPIIFTYDSKPLYEGTLVLATLVQKAEVGTQPASKSSHEPRASTSIRKASSEVSVRKNNLPNSASDDGDVTEVQDVTFPLENSRVEEIPHQQKDAVRDDTSHSEPVVPLSRNNHKTAQEEEEDSDTVPSSPPAKRSKFFFRRCFEATFNPDTLPGHNIILAEDSDEGD
ncbi:cell cycle checkpoint control protein RAD9A-like isoform X1 [Portunus trituberculatus]|uniref:cell cycle checkpoint control protein RAD9A-like isoform X1 n=2 Tax=Portunus trituberculatus TaxID=210409 RepID=UPI001E1CBEBC|nr:cell cycle checkpoint control protein RAD9A-like isoform X1 [Portunus trituberculatus]